MVDGDDEEGDGKDEEVEGKSRSKRVEEQQLQREITTREDLGQGKEIGSQGSAILSLLPSDSDDV